MLSKKLINILMILLIITTVLNLGRFFDITQPPLHSDIIVCLGGGYIERLEKTAELYNAGYSDLIIFTGSFNYKINSFDFNKKKLIYFRDKGIGRENLIYAPQTNTTMKEVLFVKKYMLEHHLKSAIFISDPPHSKRISFLADTVANYSDDNLSFIVVGSNVDWWDKRHYYQNQKAIKYVIREILKLPSNFLAYQILEKLDLLDDVKKKWGSKLNYIKDRLNRYFNY